MKTRLDKAEFVDLYLVRRHGNPCQRFGGTGLVCEVQRIEGFPSRQSAALHGAQIETKRFSMQEVNGILKAHAEIPMQTTNRVSEGIRLLPGSQYLIL